MDTPRRKRMAIMVEATHRPAVMRNGCLTQILLAYFSSLLLRRLFAHACCMVGRRAALYHELSRQTSIHPDGKWTWYQRCHDAVQAPRDMGRAIGRESC